MSDQHPQEIRAWGPFERRARIKRMVKLKPHLKARDVARELGVDLRTARADMAAAGAVGGHGGSGGRWLVSYADFVTLMFGFFLILWASASQDPVKFSELAIAFQRAFNTGAMLGQQGTGQIVGKGGRMGQIEISPFQRISETSGELVAQMGLQDQISVGNKKEGLVITLSGSLLFDSGKADLKQQGLDVLARLANILETAPGEIRVEGHTDNVPPGGVEFPSNWELSTQRAANVLRFLTETVGMPAERFQVAGYAEFRPVVPNDTRENRAMNRRVEIILMAPQPGAAQPEPAAPEPAEPAAKVEPAGKVEPAKAEPAVKTAPAAPATTKP
jgi:chemotaxis protein MotB